MKNKMTNVRDLMIDTMDKLVNGDDEPLDGSDMPEHKRMTPEKAREVAKLGKVLVDSAKTEIMYIKEMKRDGHQGVDTPTTFFQSEEKKQIGE